MLAARRSRASTRAPAPPRSASVRRLRSRAPCPARPCRTSASERVTEVQRYPPEAEVNVLGRVGHLVKPPPGLRPILLPGHHASTPRTGRPPWLIATGRPV